MHAARKTMRKQRKVLHGCPEDRTCIVAVEAVIDAVWVGNAENLAANILVEPVGAAANGSLIYSGVSDPRWLDLAMGTKIGVAQEHIDA